MKAIILLVVALALVLPCPCAHGLATEDKPLLNQTGAVEAIVRSWLARPELAHSEVGLEILDVASLRVLGSHNGNRRFIPASTAKILTTACIYEVLGPDYRYKTALLAYGDLKKDKIDGDLVISPSQDPSLEADDIRRLIGAVQAKGVKVVEGTFKLLPVEGGYDHYTPGWLAEDWAQYWMPVSSNLVIDHNIAPGGDPGHGLKAVTEQPPFAGNALLNCLFIYDLTPGWVSYDDRTNTVRVFRSPAPQMGQAVALAVGNPDAYNLAVSRAMARALGLKIGSRPYSTSGDKTTPVAEHESKILKDIIQFTLHKSDNLYAQQLLRTLGLQAKTGRQRQLPTLEQRGLDYLTDWVVSQGVPRKEVVLFDGCGLSRKNCISPHALNVILAHMAGPRLDGGYLDLLSVEGQGQGQPGSYQFKTGAMDCVRSLSGVLRTNGGHVLAVSVIINGHTPKVSDLRVALHSLTSQLRSITSLGKLPPLPPPVVKKAKAASKRTGGKLRRRRR